jgi:alkaline phosphatase D
MGHSFVDFKDQKRISISSIDQDRSAFNRRRFLIGAGALAGLALTGQRPSYAQSKTPKFTADPFSLGVASGDPLPDGVVLWTRLAPDPLNGGGLPAQAFTVKWEVAADDRMKEVVKRGSAVASPELGHSVHVEVTGLKPARLYWYRFMIGDAVSPVGRTRTAPALNARLDRLRFAFASCQHYETGFFTAYKHMADEPLDLVVHLGYAFVSPLAIRRSRGIQRARHAPISQRPALRRWRQTALS